MAAATQPLASAQTAAQPGLDFQLEDYHVHLKGGLTIEEALAQSRNIPAMVVLAKVGIPQVELLRMPDNDGGYWRLSGVTAGL